MSDNMVRNSTCIAYYEAISISRNTSPTVFTDTKFSEIDDLKTVSIATQLTI